ncbi:MAG: YHS domain-containing (seleno)protein [Almyronema sp.]
MVLRFFSTLAVGSVAALTVGCANQAMWGLSPSAMPATPPASLPASLVEPEALPHLNIDEQGRALRGYDPVAYFAKDQAILGSKQFTAEWEGAVWYFASAQNRDLFMSSPAAYAPANGGYCTFGIVLSKKFDGDPTVWLLNEGRLYLFLNEEVKAKFLQDEVGNLAKAQNNWPKIKDKSPEELANLS